MYIGSSNSQSTTNSALASHVIGGYYCSNIQKLLIGHCRFGSSFMLQLMIAETEAADIETSPTITTRESCQFQHQSARHQPSAPSKLSKLLKVMAITNGSSDVWVWDPVKGDFRHPGEIPRDRKEATTRFIEEPWGPFHAKITRVSLLAYDKEGRKVVFTCVQYCSMTSVTGKLDVDLAGKQDNMHNVECWKMCQALSQ